jgi:hypothetical protein
MSLLFRMIGKLSEYKRLGASSLIEACQTLSPKSFIDSSDCSEAVSELIKYQRTNALVHKVVTSHFENTSKSLTLENSSWNDMIFFLNQGLLTRDMHAVDSAVSLMWNNFKDKDFPLMQVSSR